MTFIFSSTSASDLYKEPVMVSIMDRIGQFFSSENRRGVLRFRTVVYQEKSGLSMVLRKRDNDYGTGMSWDGMGPECCFCDGMEK